MNQFQSEVLTAYEIGYRAQASARFSIDIAGFLTTITISKRKTRRRPCWREELSRTCWCRLFSTIV